MRRTRLLRALCLLGTCLLAVLATAGTGAASAPLTPTQTVRAYIAAINAKDGAGVCALLHPAEAKALGYYIPWLFARAGTTVKPVACAKAARLVGSGCCADSTQAWKHAKVLHTSAPSAAGHGLTWIDVRMADRFEGSSKYSEPRTTRFWLTRLHDRWVVIRRSSALIVAMFSSAGPLADEIPATQEPHPGDVKIPAATFTCSDEISAVDDPAGDAHATAEPWLDIRHTALANTPAMCVTVQLAAPPMPGMAFRVSFDTKDHSQSQSGDLLIIGNDGTIYFSGTDKEAVGGTDYGMAGPATLVMRFSNIAGFHPDTVSVDVVPVAQSEPLIRTQPPLSGGDRAEP